MSNPNNICDYVTVDIFTPEECEEILEYCAKHYKLKNSTLSGGKGSDPYPEIRTSKLAWLLKKDKGLFWVHDRIKDVIMSVNEQKYNFDIDGSERIQFTKYKVGHHYAWHIDLGPLDPVNKRKLSITVNLTDNTCYDGGNLILLILGSHYHTIPPKVGEAIIFPSYIPHMVTEIEPKPGSG